MSKRKYILILFASIFLLIFLILLSLTVGNYKEITLLRIFEIIFNINGVSNTEKAVIFNIRISRTIVAIVCGSSLSLAGSLFQEIFKNDLASPDILGVSSGASVGAAFAILIGLSNIAVQFSSLIFGLISIALTFCLSILFKKSGKMSLILSGILISGLFSSVLSMIKYIADPNSVLPTIVYWLMGSVDNSNYSQIIIALIPICICSIFVLAISWRTNFLKLSDGEAKSKGVNIIALRLICIVMATMLTSSSISICGNIGWIGLCIPHLARLLCGRNNKLYFPLSMFLGASFLLFVDIFNRSISTAEIPVGIFTGIVGVLLFIICLLVRRWQNDFES